MSDASELISLLCFPKDNQNIACNKRKKVRPFKKLEKKKLASIHTGSQSNRKRCNAKKRVGIERKKMQVEPQICTGIRY